ncbi:hypothetical protein J6590_060798 [Homalodisca vitripennis]|nr:hypothetical protein J6590_060798 [Homalodisca vitripennis]
MPNNRLPVPTCEKRQDKVGCAVLVLTEANPDVLCLSEHWLKKEEINLDAFCVERVIKLSAIELTDRSLVVVSGCLGYLIRPRPNSRLMFCGDFNVHLECSSKEEGSFTNFFRGFGLFVTNRLPTRGSACLDTIVTDLDSWNYTVAVVNPMVGDHADVAIKIENCLISTPPSPSWYVRYSSRKRAVRDELLPLFRRELESVDWDEVIAGNTPVAAFDSLIETFVFKFD